MRVGIWADLRNPPQWRRPWHDHYSWTLDVICEAERLCARSVWLSEHHFFEDGYLPQPLTFAAAIAARTRTFRIGTAVLLAPLRHPLQLAEEAATVDVLSDGRLDLGLGTGYRRPEFAAFGASRARRYEVFEEMVQQLRDLWSCTTVPTPIQDPLPLWGGFVGPRGAGIAGRLGMGLIAVGNGSYKDYASGIAEAGWDGSHQRVVSGLISLIVADDPESAAHRIGPHFAYQHDTYKRYEAEGSGRPAEPASRTLRVLTPADAVRYIKQSCEGVPVEEVFCWISLAGMPTDLAERHVELLCTTVAGDLADV